jgi:hypothetical protein
LLSQIQDAAHERRYIGRLDVGVGKIDEFVDLLDLGGKDAVQLERDVRLALRLAVALFTVLACALPLLWIQAGLKYR